MLTAGRHFDHQLLEVFAGLPRAETRLIAYPTAARPQACGWHPVLLCSCRRAPARPAQNTLETVAAGAAGLGRIPRLSGVRAFEQPWEIRLEEGAFE